MIVGLVPACGQSRRMGRPKLVLPVEGTPMVGRVVGAMRAGGLERVLVVVPPGSEEGAERVAEAARSAGAEVLVAERVTPDMRSTVELGLARLGDEVPVPEGIALAPGDAVGLSSGSIARLREEAARRPGRIVVPSVEGRRGHPLFLPWVVARRILDLPADVGVNALLRQREGEIDEIALEDQGLLEDVDTPEDYRRWAR